MKDEETFRNGKRLMTSVEQMFERGLRTNKRLRQKLHSLHLDKTPEERACAKKDTRTREEYSVSDNATAVALSEIFRSGGAVRLTGKFGPGVQYYGVNRSYQDRADTYKTAFVDDTTTVHVPRWQDTGVYLKTIAWVHGALQYGSRARTFTLNLSDEIIEKAIANEEGFASFIRKSLTRNIQRAYHRHKITFEPMFFFWVEAHRKDRPHLHGVIVLPEEAAMGKVYRSIREAIKLTGGKWTGNGHALVIKRFLPENPFGWAWYSSKLKETSSIMIRALAPHDPEPRLVGVTRGLNRLSKDAYENARQRGEILSGVRSSKMSERQ